MHVYVYVHMCLNVCAFSRELVHVNDVFVFVFVCVCMCMCMCMGTCEWCVFRCVYV